MDRRFSGSLLAACAVLLSATGARAQPYTPPQPYPTPYYPSPPPYGSPPYGSPPYGSPPYGSPPYGSPPYAPPPYGQPPAYRPPPFGPPPYGNQAPPRRAASSSSGSYIGGVLGLGLRGGYTQVQGSDADDSGASVQLAIRVDGVLTSDYFTLRLEDQEGIGGSFAGLDGVYRSTLMMGARGYFDDNHGPFFRLGFGGQILGNGKLYVSYLELPALQVGYQYMDEDVLLELGPRGGVMLDGRYNVGDEARRKFGTALDAGAFGIVQVRNVHLSGEWIRVFARQTQNGTPVDMLRGAACVSIVAVALCLDGARYTGDVAFGSPKNVQRAQSLYLGAMLGVGVVGTSGGTGGYFGK